jgi:hypothetical protein
MNFAVVFKTLNVSGQKIEQSNPNILQPKMLYPFVRWPYLKLGRVMLGYVNKSQVISIFKGYLIFEEILFEEKEK